MHLLSHFTDKKLKQEKWPVQSQIVVAGFRHRESFIPGRITSHMVCLLRPDCFLIPTQSLRHIYVQKGQPGFYHKRRWISFLWRNETHPRRYRESSYWGLVMDKRGKWGLVRLPREEGEEVTAQAPTVHLYTQLSAPVVGKKKKKKTLNSQRREGVFLTLPGICCKHLALLSPVVSLSCLAVHIHYLIACSECWCVCVCVFTACMNLAHTGAVANCRVLSLVSCSLLAVLQPRGPLPESAAAFPWIPPALPDTTNQVVFRDPLQRPLCCLLCQVPFKKMTAIHFQ